ncbi:EF hand domain containing protein [Echinococcus multilocularis]|uniref:EF hand domain containing protein n=1 Tax=Echinococcus multilocularis TaxID=6211 RepID=A0A068YIU7_ECHMU|nr:EF hand domain containing protein [Echinococcus multilocularis]
MEVRTTQPIALPVIYDCREDFLSHFAGKAFSTFEAFSKELQAFEDATGMQYMMKRTCLFNEGTLGREYLIYRYMHYACVRHVRPASKMGQRSGGTHCQAYFSVGTRKHKLFVRHYDMQHNHPAHMDPMIEVPPPAHSQTLSSLPPPPPPRPLSPPPSCTVGNDAAATATVQDSTADFLRIFHRLSFVSFAELQAKMEEFQLATGNRYVKTNTRRLPLGSPYAETLVYSHLVYICYRYGNQVSEAKQRRLQRTSKIGCRSKIYFYSQGNQLHVRRYDFRHNHEVRPDLVHFPPKRRRTRKEKEAEEAAAAAVASASSTSIGATVCGTDAAPLALSSGMVKRDTVTRASPGGLFRHPSSLNFASEEVDEDVEEEEVDEEDEFDEDDDDEDNDLPQLYLQSNGYGHHNLLEDDFRSVFPMHDFEIPLQPQQSLDASSCFNLPPGAYHLYGGSLPTSQAIDMSVEDLVPMGHCDLETEEDNLSVETPRSLSREPLEAMLPSRLDPQLQRLGELASSCGPIRFASRLRELKALGDKWTRENKVLMLKSRRSACHNLLADMRLLVGITCLYFLAQNMECAPVHKTSLPRGKQAQLISDEFRDYLGNLFKAIENSTEFLDHVSSLHETDSSVNISLLSKEVREKLNLIKYGTKNYFVDLLKLKRDSEAGKKVSIPSDIAKALDIGNSTEFSAEDVETILKMLRERQDAIDREEIVFLNEVEVMKVLERWEAHVNDTTAVREKVQHDFELAKKRPKPGRFHEPGSRAQEREQWQKGDDMPEDEFDPRVFFIMHDLNSDGVWDPEEIDAMLSAQIGQIDEDRPERQDEYRVQMRRKMLEVMDRNGDGLIDYKEHMKHSTSPEGMNDSGWEPDEDEDEDLDDFGPFPTEEDLQQISKKIHNLDAMDPVS